MGSFYTVTSGAITASADINQYAAILNASTAGQVAVKNATIPFQGYLSSAPASDTTVFGGGVSGDTTNRVSDYIRGSDGYGGVRAGTGSALTAHLYAQSGGWKIDESLTVATNLTVNGASTLAGLAVSGSSSLDGGTITTDGSGHLTARSLKANAPMTLASGNQETGYCGGSWSNPTAGQNGGVGVNFKTTLTNTPTGITLTPDASGSQNIASTHVSNLATSGFNLFLIFSASGTQSFWHGTYTTQGNCLLAVDTVARTFDHHCDNPGCGHVARDVPFADLMVDSSMGAAPGALALSYACVACGAVEGFNSGLGSAAELDMTPQGSDPAYATTYGEQARFVRALQTALGYATAA